MTEAAAVVVGEHDFTSFAAVDEEKRDEEVVAVHAQNGVESGKNVTVDECKRTTAGSTNVRTVYSSAWVREGDEFTYKVSGSGFLHHMVRNLVGTFLLVGKGTLRMQDIGTILEARNRSAAGATAPASGLYLVSVEY